MIVCDAVFEKGQEVVEEFSGGKLRNVALRLVFGLFWLFCYMLCFLFVFVFNKSNVF